MTERIFINAISATGDRINLSVSNGVITDICSELPEHMPREIIDLQQRLVIPAFVDGHIHLDKSFVGDRWRPHRPAGSLRERMAIEKAELADARPVVERAHALIRQAASYGTLAMRSHVDVDATTGLNHLHAVMEAREKWRDLVDIELVAFPQAGVISCPGTADILEAALQDGADVIGGIDPTTLDTAAEEQLDIVFGLADKYGVKVDIHLHEPDLQGIDQLQRIAQRTQALGLGGRVAVSHAYSLGDVSAHTLEGIARTLADASVSIMTNAPGDRDFPPVLKLREAGVNVFAGNDNIRDAWWPYGNGDMLQRAMLIAYRSGFNTDEELNVAFEMVTQAAARVVGLDGYALQPGHPATFLVIDAPNVAAAVAEGTTRREIVRQGQFWTPGQQPSGDSQVLPS
uniref:amidohydrolase family protein n=1 Tax=Halomonas sp. TaxID=1486246 RepID=UPI00260E1BBC|nr:amidohydrolase family protein [Halomonas sp.]